MTRSCSSDLTGSQWFSVCWQRVRTVQASFGEGGGVERGGGAGETRPGLQLLPYHSAGQRRELQQQEQCER